MNEYYKYKYYKYKQKYLLMKGGGNGDFTSLPSDIIQQISKFLRPHEKAKLKSTGTQINEDILALDTSKSVYNEYVALLKEKGLENLKDNYDQTVDWSKRIQIIKWFGDDNWREVKEAQKTKVLLLDRKGIQDLPKEICNLVEVILILLRYNDIREIPSDIGKLTNLTGLNLAGNNIIKIPSEIGNLRNLKWINLADNRITEIPLAIGNLSKLEELKLTGNKLTKIPPEIQQKLPNLKIII